MSDQDPFDMERLRDLDVPELPAARADARIRSAMLDAFDAAAPATETAPVDDIEIISLDEQRPTPATAPRRTWPFLAAAAALLAIVAVATVIIRDDDPVTDVAGENELVVERFCSSTFDDLDDDLLAFADRPGGEVSQRALRSVEQLAQAYADLGTELTGPVRLDVAAAGQAFLDTAAEIRRNGQAGDDPDSVDLAALIGDIATAIDELPGAGACATGPLRGDGS